MPPATLDTPHFSEISLAKPNYSYEKRQRELAKKKKQDQKLARKQEAREAKADTAPEPGHEASGQ